MIVGLVTNGRVLGFAVLLGLFFATIGLAIGREWPGPGWQPDPANECRVYLPWCPEYHFCPRCHQHWPRHDRKMVRE